MADLETLAAIQQALVDLEQISFVAHRDTQAALAVVQPFGDKVALQWVMACKALFEHDRDAGKAFIRGSEAACVASQTVLPWTQQALQFLAWRGSWKAVDGFMQQLPDAYQSMGAEGEARWATLGLAWCERHLDSGVAYFRCPVLDLEGGHGIAGVEEMLAPSEELFSKRRLALGTYLCGAIRVRNLLGIDAVLPWAKRGADILQAGRLRGESFFKLESEESLALLLENLPGFRTPEHQRLLQLILFAWYGQPFDLLEGNWSPDKGRAFIETDGDALYLPMALPNREEAMLGVLHAAGHLVFHSFERRYIEALFREVGRDHPPLDEHQRITWRPLFAAFGDDMIRFQLIFDLCEDTRVDAQIGSLVPNYLARLAALAATTVTPAGEAAAYFDWSRAVLNWMVLGVPEQAEFEILRPLLRPDATIVDAFIIANEIYKNNELPRISLVDREHAYIPARAPNAARPVYPRRVLDQAEFGTGTEDKDDVVKNNDIKPNPEQKQIPKHAAGEDPDFDIPPEETTGSGGRVGVGIPQQAHVVGYAKGAEYSEKGKPYAEWDYRDNRYKRNWAWVQEKELTELDANEASKILTQYAPALKRLKRAIQTQKPSRMAPLRRQFDGDELDLEATISYIAEKRAGMSPKANIYKQRVVQHRDTAVTLLADISTSIMQANAEGGGRVVDSLRAGMLLFAESMEEVGDPYSLAGFASKYRDNVSYYTIKGFNDKLTMHTRAVLGGLSGRLATRMGAAIRHAVEGFDLAPSQRRLLLILSDGRPADYDDGGDERYLHEDTRMAVKEAVDKGVHPFCITLDAAGSQYLPQIFGPGHYLVLDHINELPKKLPEIYLRLRK
ncbi:nitric oxide reductase activation protein NorD [Sulfuriferula nivalis]|uniref:VWFA domain-containing protein n=1 Tax=Sulfuriferula nivalis TaxID=2675298 RepID=A0A809S1J7_9PROT|nr:VWA domain-containing protein [Sulfuriferula nivalis]BBP00448.1 hypothetical protein SFSGTM_11560 [Sulfuriferula nivalis]